jgi:multimeric flavodoxin WrbA
MSKPGNPQRILVLLGSPRKNSNSTLLAEQIKKGAESQGAKVETVLLNDMDIRPCQACYACQKEGIWNCVADDDMQSLYPKLIEADAWVIASPVYWFTMSGQTKLFMDRCFALFSKTKTKSPLFGKRIAIAMSYADADAFISGCANALRSFQDAFNHVGAKIVGMVYGSAEAAGEIRSNKALMQEAEELGRNLAGA